METPINKALSAAVLRLLRPLVRLLLRNGVSYGTFADLAKWVFVDVAAKEFGVPRRKQSDARISIITGLTRKEVARVKHIETPDDTAAAEQYNRAARVISGWLSDGRYTDAEGRPLMLPFEGDEKSFHGLVKSYSGDMTARAMLDELQRVGAVERGPEGDLSLTVSAYVPKGSDAEKLHILGSDVAHLITTIDYNLQEDTTVPHFQRKVAYDNLPVESLPKLRKLTEERGQLLLEQLNRYLAQQDRDSNPAAQGTGRKRAGVGIYYFEEDVPEEK